MPREDACDVCGHPDAPHRCKLCGLKLCHTHQDCPECEDEYIQLFTPDYEDYENDE